MGCSYSTTAGNAKELPTSPTLPTLLSSEGQEKAQSRGSRLLLISDNLPLFEVLVRAALDDVVVVPVQYAAWSLEELVSAIVMRAGAPAKQYSSVGLLDHGSAGKFCLLKSLGGEDGALELKEVKENESLQAFFKLLASYVKAPKELHNWRSDIEHRIDLMACCVAAGDGMELVTYLEDLTEVNWAASTDKTGAGANAENGFDWVMETEEHLGLGSIHTHYFVEAKIKEWKEVCLDGKEILAQIQRMSSGELAESMRKVQQMSKAERAEMLKLSRQIFGNGEADQELAKLAPRVAGLPGMDMLQSEVSAACEQTDMCVHAAQEVLEHAPGFDRISKATDHISSFF